MPIKQESLADFVTSSLQAAAVPGNVPAMQAYLKTSMPFFGVKKPALVPIFREMKRRFAPENRRQYEAGVRSLWQLPHREQKYAAIEYAAQHSSQLAPASLPLYERNGARRRLVGPRGHDRGQRHQPALLGRSKNGAAHDQSLDRR